MIINIANPIYDSVFKYLVEDERIAKINNRLDKVLSVFDQTAKDKHNRQMLTIDDSLYAGDPDMEYIIHRLLMAVSDANVRQDMNVEDEYFSAIENRDTAIMKCEKKIAEQDEKILEQSEQLSLKDAQLSEKDEEISKQKHMLAQMIASMQESGMSLESIATMTNRSIEEIRQTLGD